MKGAIMETKQGAEIISVLNEIRGGELYDIFNLLPDIAGGANWLSEIKDTASAVLDYVEASETYEIDTLRDFGAEWADRQTEDYYKPINDKVQELSLWASDEIEAEVEELFSGAGWANFNKLNSYYLYTASRMLWDAVTDQAFTHALESEEANA